MASATAPELSIPLTGGRHHFLLRRLHSLAGILLGGYLSAHLLVNATIVQGADLYQAQVEKIHKLPLLPSLELTLVFIPLLFHMIYGIWISLSGQPNAISYPFARNWCYLLQRISAVAIALFVLFHVAALRYGMLGSKLAFDAKDATRAIGQHMDVSLFITWFVYPLGILAACFHLANGIWTAGVSWGLATSAAGQRRWGTVSVAVFVTTMAVGMTALLAASAI